jgi:hypothetical protein
MGARSVIDAERIASLSLEFGLVRPEERLEKLNWERVLGNPGNANVRTDVPDIQAAVAMQNPAELNLTERLECAPQ